MESKPLVSVIIPTYNSEKTIGICLRSIEEQTYPNIEVIVVDNYSKDGTQKIAEKYGARVLQLKAERTRAKNFGLREARGKYVCFIDSDMELAKNVIEECVELMESDEKIGGIIIPERSIGNSFWVRVRDFERSFYAGTEVESARFFRRDLAERAGGFNEEIIAFEESTLPQKIEKMGYNVKARISAEILHHEEDFSLFGWLRKKFYYGETAPKYKREFSEYADSQMNIFRRLSIFLKNRRFFSNPLLALGVLVLKALEFSSAGLGVLKGIVEEQIFHPKRSYPAE
ncbi:MAG: glycosyltransferase family A protein [Candidatus Bathyarchaeia archaeon]